LLFFCQFSIQVSGKERRGPFKKPKTTPKPKAKKNSPLPDWLEFTNLGKSLTS
jgi:hypothetical protein